MGIRQLAAEAEALASTKEPRSGAHRVLLGIAGPPGSGKSTLARSVVSYLNQRHGANFARNVPMDGFHHSNVFLDDRGLRPLKGAPQTFDIDRYIDKLIELRARTSAPVLCPEFDRRHREEPVEDRINVPADTRLVVSEGNYLLVDQDRWIDVRPLFDSVWYVDVPRGEAERRLRARYRAIGDDPATAQRRVHDNDLINFATVEESKTRANRRIEQSDFSPIGLD